MGFVVIDRGKVVEIIKMTTLPRSTFSGCRIYMQTGNRQSVCMAKIIQKGNRTGRPVSQVKKMNQITTKDLAKLLADNPSIGCKLLDRPFVLLIKTFDGTFIVSQANKMQRPMIIGNPLPFKNDTVIIGVFDIELGSGKHIIALVTTEHHESEEIAIFTIGLRLKDHGTLNQTPVTAFFAYEAETDISVNCISIIEEADGNPIHSDATRFGKSSSKMLKNQLKMYLSLTGVNKRDSVNIVSSFGKLPQSESNQAGGV